MNIIAERPTQLDTLTADTPKGRRRIRLVLGWSNKNAPVTADDARRAQVRAAEEERTARPSTRKKR